jgi:SRSO17 transposase
MTTAVCGLISVNGRRAIREIASATGTSAGEQRLHHFISRSTWDWWPLRAALIRYPDEATSTTAW